MAVKTKNYEAILEKRTFRTAQLFGGLQHNINALAGTILPEKLEENVRELIKKTLATYNARVEAGDVLNFGNGASHFWISKEADKERVILIRFENEY